MIVFLSVYYRVAGIPAFQSVSRKSSLHIPCAARLLDVAFNLSVEIFDSNLFRSLICSHVGVLRSLQAQLLLVTDGQRGQQLTYIALLCDDVYSSI
jgi:hypothetical protein